MLNSKEHLGFALFHCRNLTTSSSLTLNHQSRCI